MSPPDLPSDYYGKILNESCGHNLRDTVAKQISTCTSFDEINLSVMPYIAAWRTDQTGIWYEFVSARFLDLFQCSPEDIAQIFHDSIIDHRQYRQMDVYPDIEESILDKTALKKQRKQLREETAREGVVEAIYKILLKNNANVWLKDWASVTFFEEDCICLSSGYLCNVTLEMSQKDHIRAMNVSVNRDKNLLVEAERSAALGQISAKIYHEIRNPILSIGGLARQLLKKQESTSPPLQMIVKEADRLENVLENLFDYTKSIQLNLAPHDVVTLAKESIALLQTDIEKQRIQITFTSDDNIPLIMVDKDQLLLSFVHILKNSIEAMPDGGNISIVILSQNDSVKITIKDSGHGIREGHSKRVTEPFFTTKVYGLGLGLSLAQKAIDLHGGSLNFESLDSCGTSVIVSLPVQP